MGSIALDVVDLGKKYRIGLQEEQHDTFGELITSWLKYPARNFRRLKKLSFITEEEADDIIWALRHVSFQVKHGEVVGIIGRNGAGKSTLLKILSEITNPTNGYVDIYGRVSSLLEVGTGFHPELTGRENVYLNGTILGMKKVEIDRKFDEIVAFSEIAKFIDTPVKRYSSGMKVRLAFSVAAHLEPEILLVDEVLAVGDVAFQKKCLGKMERVAGEGRTVLFVSHNTSMVQALCQRGIVLSKGGVEYDGPIDDAINRYLQLLEATVSNPFGENPERRGNRDIYLTGCRVVDATGEPNSNLTSGAPATIEFDYMNPSGASSCDITFTVYDSYGSPITHINFGQTGYRALGLAESGTFECNIACLPLLPGDYRVAVGVWVNGQSADHIPSVLKFRIVTSVFFENGRVPNKKYAKVMIKHAWKHKEAPVLVQ